MMSSCTCSSLEIHSPSCRGSQIGCTAPIPTSGMPSALAELEVAADLATRICKKPRVKPRAALMAVGKSHLFLSSKGIGASQQSNQGEVEWRAPLQSAINTPNTRLQENRAGGGGNLRSLCVRIVYTPTMGLFEKKRNLPARGLEASICSAGLKNRRCSSRTTLFAERSTAFRLWVGFLGYLLSK